MRIRPFSPPFKLAMGAIATGTLLFLGTHESVAQVESNYICYAIDASGQVINLEPLCAAPPVQTAAQTGANSTNAASNPDSNPAFQAFLETFNTGASPESLAIADLIGQDNVLTLGASMCPYIAAGTSPADLNVAFSNTSLPPAFLQDVGDAAAATVCANTQSTL